MSEPPLPISPRLTGFSRAAVMEFLTGRSGLLICALFALAGLLQAGDYGIGPDELPQRRIATANLNYILGQGAAFDDLPHPHAYYGAAFELPLLLAERALGLEDYAQVHRLRLFLTHLLFIVGGYFCWRLAYRLGGNRMIALLILLLFLLHPRLYGHSFVNTKDLPFLSMFVLVLYLLERAFRKETAGAFILLGVAVGLLTNLRIMGLALFPVILALRGLDLGMAAGGPARQGILRRAGLFFLAGALTFYAATPYAWTNPIGYLAGSLEVAVNHPQVWPQLFQGEIRPSDTMPPHYGITWFGITTPPLIMLLGLVGMVVAAAGGIARPRAVFGNTRRRFLLLLLAALLLPPLAAALLGPNQYSGWRHLYFVYAPLCLLAAVGLRGLAAGLARWRPWRVGVYALTAAGLGLLLLQIAQLYPLQYVYFNFLVDRATPEYLRTQYEMDYWRLAYREGLEHLLARHPGETLVVRMGPRHRNILPAAERQRLLLATGGRHRADYELTHRLDPAQPDLAFNSLYGRRYRNAVIAVRPLEDSLMTPAAAAAYREIYRQAVAGEPIIRTDYKVYLNGRRLTFVQENCAAESRDAWLGVKLFPPDPETLPPHLWRPGSYVTFHNHRVRLGEVCLAVIQLPDYAAGDLILMQRNLSNYGPVGLPLWEKLYSLTQPGLRELIAAGRRNQMPAAVGPDAFDVFIDRDDGRNRLLYAKGDCAQDEFETRVTLHIAPVDLADLPAYSQGSNFENRDFQLPDYGVRLDGECLAIVPLPDYPIAAIGTGQSGLWERNFHPQTAPDRLREMYAALSNRPPDAQAVFNLYRQDNRLIYLREACTAADTAAGFFLHLIPQNTTDLPAARRSAGFANRDFAFAQWGGSFDGKCLAAVPLPEYPIKTIRTGQHSPEQGELWAAELAAAP